MAARNEVGASRDRSRRRKADSGEAACRTQILDAAVACILDLGFYRASTNEIARRANVSWGSIQYYFGSREALMLAVVEELSRRFSDTVRRAWISGDHLEDRLASLYGVLATQYGHPNYLAHIQVLLNLRHDPNTSAEVARALAHQEEESGTDVRRLLTEAVGDVKPATRDMVFHSVRGMALSQQLGDAIAVNPKRARPSPATVREELESFITGLAAAVRLDPAAKD